MLHGQSGWIDVERSRYTFKGKMLKGERFRMRSKAPDICSVQFCEGQFRLD